MKQVVLSKPPQDVVYVDELNQRKPVFAMREGKMAGMFVKENSKGWILRTGEDYGCSGYWDTLKEAMESASGFGFTFFVEEG